MGDGLMESRGQKRFEMTEELPADKRACSSQFRPSSLHITPQALVNSTSSALEMRDCDMDTSSSSTSFSGRSEGDGERDSPYGSCDSDDMNDGDHRYSSLRELQRSRSYGDSAKYNRILSGLSNDAEPSGQSAALTELCELLSFSTEDSISSMLADQLSPILVKLAKHENNPDIMLLAIRALTYLCDVFPRSSGVLVKHDAVPALCQRLMAIEYLDVAEQCLQALEKISHAQPLVCLQSGVIMAVLGYIDFFSTSVQRTALCTVVNICKKLPSEYLSPVMEAVPRLCNLLQYEDQQLVELVATCLIKIVDCVKDSSEMLTEFYDHGLIDQIIHLLDLNSRVTLCPHTYTGLVRLVARIASGSADAVRTLFKLNFGSILKDALSNPDLFHQMPCPRPVGKNFTQVHEILKLLHELLPEVARDKVELLSSKEKILLDQTDRLQKFGMDILPTLMQVVSRGANVHVCYGCLSVISKLLRLSKPESLLEFFEGVNIASFLAGVFTRNDHHIMLLALQISETILEKCSDDLMQSFIKEGVLFAIDGLLMADSCSQLTFPMINSSESRQFVGRETTRCLCYAFHWQSESTSDSEMCKVYEDSVHNLAERIKTKYFSAELHNSQNMVTDVLQDLRNASAAITDLLNIYPNGEAGVQSEEKLCNALHKVMLQLSGNEPISTFELIESGIIRALLNYLSNGKYLSRSCNVSDDQSHAYDIQRRFENFERILLSTPEQVSNELPLSLLVRKLQSALSTVETFPVIVGYAPRQRGSYAAVPSGRCTMYPCLNIRFVWGEELCLDDYSVDAVTVDPFCFVEEIEQYLLLKMSQKKMEPSTASAQACIDAKVIPVQVPLNAASHPVKSMAPHVSGIMCTDSPGMQGSSRVEIHSSDANAYHTATSSPCLSGDEEDSKKGQCQSSSSTENIPLKLALFLEGEQLNYSSTLYQEILQRRIESQCEIHNGARLWSNTYTVTYRRLSGTEISSQKKCNNLYDGGASNKVSPCWQVMSLFSRIFSQSLSSELNQSSPSSEILFLLRSLEMMNRFAYHLVSYERMNAFAEGKIDDLDDLKVTIPTLSQYEFVNSRLTEKLEQQMRDPSVIHVGATPLWCSQLMAGCPFLFSFEARQKYFQLAALGRLRILPNMSSHNDTEMSRDRRASAGNLPRKKFLVYRDYILESATRMMDLYACKNVVIEVEYSEEIGTGLGPTLEFYTLVSHEFQKAGSGMWRGDNLSPADSYNEQGYVSTSGLFPRPWSPTSSNVNGIEFSDVIKKFILLGQVVGKALRDGRVLDIPFSKAFYKLILGRELSLCDIQSFDPELGRTLLEFQALINRRKCMKLGCGDTFAHGVCSGFQSAKIEDLCLDLTLPGYPDYILAPATEDVMVNIDNLEEYLSLVLDATLHTGIWRQVEAFKSGLNQVIPDKHLNIFSEEELERLLCGEHDSWLSNDLFDHIKFDHGYTAGSPPISNLMAAISEFNHEERRAFLQFVTGAPRLPPGGLAALNPKLTIVCKQSSNGADTDLPSVMTCANYLKLPPYSSKERMKEKLLYAITEGQGSFHLS